MATSKYIRGLSGAGFRVPTNGSATAKQKVTEKLVGGTTNYQVDLDHLRTQQKLSGERDNFVRVASNVATTATIIGLTRYGFRIPTTASPSVKTVKLGSGVHTVDLNNAQVRRILRRSFGRYAFSASATSLTIRGIAGGAPGVTATTAQQQGFEIKDSKAGAGTDTITNANPTNVNNLDTVTVGAKTYTFKTALTEKQATAILSSTGTVPAAGDTVVINNITYRFESTLALANDVKIGASSDATLDSLVKAVNQTGVVGTDYFAGTVAPTNVTAAARVGTGATGKVTFTAAVGTGTAANAYPSTKTGTQLSFLGATFGAGGGATVIGVNSVANEVLVAGSADASLTNLSEAINAGTNPGVDYASATTANVDATASAVATHAITLTAVPGGSEAITISESTAGARLTVAAATLQDKLSRVYSGVSVVVNPQDPDVYTQLRRHFKHWIEA